MSLGRREEGRAGDEEVREGKLEAKRNWEKLDPQAMIEGSNTDG